MFYENYWSQKTRRLSDFEMKWPKIRKFIPKNLVTLVDFGCGKGDILEEIAKENPDTKLIGLDVSETALREAQKLLPNAEFRKVEDGGSFGLPDNSVDFVFTSEVIEHVYDTENAVSEMARILKPGGQVLLTTPYHGLVKNILLILFNFDTHFNPTGSHIRFFSKKSLFQLFESRGFEIVHFGFYGRFYPIPFSIFIVARKK